MMVKIADRYPSIVSLQGQRLRTSVPFSAAEWIHVTPSASDRSRPDRETRSQNRSLE
ncbi:unnamed protein product [Larinioides sclopetarius]|uniref:Uncharacterized protein n=1 Tax=Larinioides sclopetarius TaxID=280406 RepID=A0AAV2BNL7_9ARAC